jgi:hypothetical protein
MRISETGSSRAALENHFDGLFLKNSLQEGRSNQIGILMAQFDASS